MRWKWTPKSKTFAVVLCTWLSMIALIGVVMVLLWGAIQNKAPIELRAVFILAFGIGSMWLLLLIGSLYVILRAFHLWTDIDTPSLTKENPVSP